MISKERKAVIKNVAIGLSVNAGIPIEKQIGTIREQVDRILDVLKLDQTEDYKSLSELVAREKEEKKSAEEPPEPPVKKTSAKAKAATL